MSVCSFFACRVVSECIHGASQSISSISGAAVFVLGHARVRFGGFVIAVAVHTAIATVALYFNDTTHVRGARVAWRCVAGFLSPCVDGVRFLLQLLCSCCQCASFPCGNSFLVRAPRACGASFACRAAGRDDCDHGGHLDSGPRSGIRHRVAGEPPCPSCRACAHVSGGCVTATDVWPRSDLRCCWIASWRRRIPRRRMLVRRHHTHPPPRCCGVTACCPR